MKALFTIFIFLISISSRAQLNVGAGTHIVNGATSFIVLHDVGLNNSGNFDQQAGTIKFSGSAHTEIAGSQSVKFYSLQFTKNLPGARLTLMRSIHVRNELTFGAGLLDLNGFNIDLGTTGVLISEKENGRIFSNNGGVVLRTDTMNSPVAANPGNLGMIISSSSNMGLVTIRRGHTSQTNGSGQGNSIKRYFDIIPAANNNLNATLRLHYFDAELNSLTENTLMLWSSVNNTSWVNEGVTSGSTSQNYIERTGINSMKRFTLSSPANPLPVTGLKLSGLWVNEKASLKWTTVAEYNNSHFEIERRFTDENTFYNIGRVNSLHSDGNSNSLSSYFKIDEAYANRGIIYYRLKQVDRTGNYSWSNTIAITPSSENTFISNIYPSLVISGSVFITAGNLDINQMDISIFDAKGKEYLRKRVRYESQFISLPVMASGQYFLVASSGIHIFKTPFIIK